MLTAVKSYAFFSYINAGNVFAMSNTSKSRVKVFICVRQSSFRQTATTAVFAFSTKNNFV